MSVETLRAACHEQGLTPLETLLLTHSLEEVLRAVLEDDRPTIPPPEDHP